MRILEKIVSAPEDCPYLPGRRSSQEFRIALDVTQDDLERFLVRGWRRFGPAYFRPACKTCTECVSIRIPADRFEPSRAQRRVWRGVAPLRVTYGPPRIDDERVELYRRWHAERRERLGWRAEPMTYERYHVELAFPHEAARELAWYDGAELIAVSLVDETRESVSAVYTYHAPERARLSLGTASVLWQLQRARDSGRAYVYLGYRVVGCRSSEYKSAYRPHELLRGWPDLDAEAASSPG